MHSAACASGARAAWLVIAVEPPQEECRPSDVGLDAVGTKTGCLKLLPEPLELPPQLLRRPSPARFSLTSSTDHACPEALGCIQRPSVFVLAWANASRHIARRRPAVRSSLQGSPLTSHFPLS